MTGRKTHPNGRSKITFIMLRHDIYDSDSWQSLSSQARSTWLELARRYNSFNNGRIPLSCREVSRLLCVSKDTASRAFNELIDRGLIKVKQNSGFNVKSRTSRRWALTSEPLNNQAPTNEWRYWKKSEHGTTVGTHSPTGRIHQE